MASKSPYSFKIPYHLNRSVKVMGLDGFQILIVFVVLAISFMISKIILCIIIIILFILLSKIKKEQKKGNPSPVDSYFLKSKLKMNIFDNDSVLNIISKNGKIAKDENTKN
jgi:hypothetical protein